MKVRHKVPYSWQRLRDLIPPHDLTISHCSRRIGSAMRGNFVAALTQRSTRQRIQLFPKGYSNLIFFPLSSQLFPHFSHLPSNISQLSLALSLLSNGEYVSSFPMDLYRHSGEIRCSILHSPPDPYSRVYFPFMVVILLSKYTKVGENFVEIRTAKAVDRFTNRIILVEIFVLV